MVVLNAVRRGQSGRGVVAVLLIVALAVLAGASVASARPAVTAATGRAVAVTETSARLTGAVQADGVTRYTFEYGRTPSLGSRTAQMTVKIRRGTAQVSAPLAHLAPGTRYYYRLIATCVRCETVGGHNADFTTPAPPPVIAAASASAIGQSTAALSATVNAEGFATSYRFQYGTTSQYGHETSLRSAGHGHTPLRTKVAITQLSLATTYHYRLVATSRGGTKYGADRTFTTNGYYTNPVFGGSMPDPYVLDVGQTHSDYWVFGTGSLFPSVHSTNLVNWTPEAKAMAVKPAWVVQSGDFHSWAPSVIQVNAACPNTKSKTCFIMFYTGLSKTYDVNCVAVATSVSPGGPYSDRGPLAEAPTLLGGLLNTPPTGPPVGCGDGSGVGNIDPSPFIDPNSGQAFLYVSTDFNCPNASSCTFAPHISVIPLSANLLTAAGPRVSLFSGVAGSWEDQGTKVPTVEGPFMEFHNGTYYLFYSGGSYVSHYAMGYATGSNPFGPFTKSTANPIFQATATVRSPGGGDDFVTGPHGGLWMVYAARLDSVTAARTLWLDPVSWQPSELAGTPDTPLLGAPTDTPQAVDP